MSRAARKAPVTPPLPASHLEAMQAAGFEALRWLNHSVIVLDSAGERRSEWLPQDLVNWEKRQFIKHATDGAYSFAGYEPQTGHRHGGRYETIHGALGWFAWLERQKG